MSTTTSVVHDFPADDAVTHTADSLDCVCGPTTQPVYRHSSPLGWLVTHYPLNAPERPGRNAHA